MYAYVDLREPCPYSHVPFIFEAVCTGLNCMTGKLQTNFKGTDSHKHECKKSQLAPSKYKLCTYTPSYRPILCLYFN